MLSHVDETWKLFAEHSEHFSAEPAVIPQMKLAFYGGYYSMMLFVKTLQVAGFPPEMEKMHMNKIINDLATFKRNAVAEIVSQREPKHDQH